MMSQLRAVKLLRRVFDGPRSRMLLDYMEITVILRWNLYDEDTGCLICRRTVPRTENRDGSMTLLCDIFRVL